MKRIIIAAIITATALGCKKSAETKTEAPVKYYFKIEPVENDGTHNTATNYKTVTVY